MSGGDRSAAVHRLLNPPVRWQRYPEKGEVLEPAAFAETVERDEIRKILRAIRLNGGGMVRLRALTDPPETWAIGSTGSPERPAVVTCSTSMIRYLEAEGYFAINHGTQGFDNATGEIWILPSGGRLTGAGLKRGE